MSRMTERKPSKRDLQKARCAADRISGLSSLPLDQASNLHRAVDVTQERIFLDRVHVRSQNIEALTRVLCYLQADGNPLGEEGLQLLQEQSKHIIFEQKGVRSWVKSRILRRPIPSTLETIEKRVFDRQSETEKAARQAEIERHRKREFEMFHALGGTPVGPSYRRFSLFHPPLIDNIVFSPLLGSQSKQILKNKDQIKFRIDKDHKDSTGISVEEYITSEGISVPLLHVKSGIGMDTESILLPQQSDDWINRSVVILKPDPYVLVRRSAVYYDHIRTPLILSIKRTENPEITYLVQEMNGRIVGKDGTIYTMSDGQYMHKQ